MSYEALITCAVVLASLVFLARSKIAPSAVLTAAAIFLMLSNVLTPAEVLAGFVNEGLVTILALYIVARGLTETGLVSTLATQLLGRPKSQVSAQMRLMGPVALSSAFMNNTPIVAMMIPAVTDWAKRFRLPIGQLLIPLSYASIIGGTCTLIGTSTNLIIHGLLLDYDSDLAIGLFDLAWVGVPCVLIVLGFTILASRWLLPADIQDHEQFKDARQYTVYMQVEKQSPLVGQSIEEAGLRHLPGTFLVEITRGERLLPAVSPEEVLQAGDILMFAGIVDAVVDLKKIRGLVPATDQIEKLDALKDQRSLVEVVVSDRCPVVSKSIRDGRFRNLYDAAIIAVARDGTQLKQKIGDIVLRAGDMLLLETHRDFADKHRYSRDFFLASQVADSEPVRHDKRLYAALALGVMIFVVVMGWYSLMQAAFLATIIMLVTGCLRPESARRSIDVPVYFVIGSAIALGEALEKTGVVALLGQWLVAIEPGNIYFSLALVFLVTAALTAIITNVAAAVLLFPVIMALAEQLQVSPMPYVITLMIASSASFATPIGYQTNLMVAGPGGYHFRDFLKIGIPVTMLVGVVTVLVVPLVWPA